MKCAVKCVVMLLCVCVCVGWRLCNLMRVWMGIALYSEVCSEVCSDALVCVCVCRLETVYEIAGDFRPTTSRSTKRGKIKLWTEDGMYIN